MDQNDKLTKVSAKLESVDPNLATTFQELRATDTKQAVSFAKLALKQPELGTLYLRVRTEYPDIAPIFLRILIDDAKLAKAYLNLKKIRVREDLKVRSNPYLRDYFIGSDGEPREIRPRYYQVQMILHLLAMNNFVVGDDTGLGKCVTPDTLINTNRGLVPIGDLRPDLHMMPDTFESVRGWEVQVGDRFVPVCSFYYSGRKPTRKVRTQYGFEIEGSRVHPLLVREPQGETWKKTQDLETGDFLCVDRGGVFPQEEPTLLVPVVGAQVEANVEVYPVPSRLNPALARLLGYIVSEDNHTFNISLYPEKNPEAHRDIMDLLASEFGWTSSEMKDTYTQSVFLQSYLGYMGVDYTLSVDKEVPTPILRATRESACEFLRGLFEASAIGTEGVEFFTASEALGKQLQIMLLRFGIVSNRMEIKGYDHTYWRLTIFGDDACRFASEIGFVSQCKRERLERILPAYGHLRAIEDRSFFYDPIVEITDGFREVVDISVPGPHQFTGNGFVNHNTFETISSLTFLFERESNTKVIILAKKSAVPQWASEFEKFTTGVNVIVSKGNAKQRAKAWNTWNTIEEGPAVIIMGYRSAVSDFKTQVQGLSGYVLVCDEVQVCKNPTAQVHQAVQYMGTQASRIWGLSATIIKNNLMEGYGIFRVVVPGLFKMSANAFKQRFCIVQMQRIKNNRRIPIIVGYHKDQIKEFKDLIDPFFLGRPKHEVADELPVLVTKQIDCEMTTFQWMKYQEALGGLLETGIGEEKEVTPLTAVTYCQEIVNHPALIDFEGEKSGKLNMLGELLTEGGDLHGEKVIVFTRFERMVTEAMAFLKKKGVKAVRVTGKETEDERDAAKRDFQDPNSDVKVVWITMAGGDSINLQAAKALVFYDTPWSAGDYIQILGRMIRIGSVHDRVYAIHLVVRGTVDQRVIQVMHKKMKLVEAIIGKRVLGEEDNGTGTDIIKIDGKAINQVYDALLDDARNMEKK